MSKNNVVWNMVWRFAERCGSQGINFVVSIILARMLSPDEYGTVALVTVLISILQVFVNSGFPNALVQKKDADRLDFSSVFYFNLVMCCAMYGVLYISAPFIADFYDRELLVNVVRILGLKLIISGLLSVQNAYVSKNLQFKKFFYATLSGTIASGVVGVWMVYNGFGVWSLVGQTLTAALVNVVVLWFVVDFRPQLAFSLNRFKGLFSFGWKLLISNIINSLYSNLRTLIIGKAYSTDDLAYYNKGNTFPALLITNVDTTLNNVLFPTLSKAQDDLGQVKVLARKSIRTSSYMIWPCMAGLFVCAEPLILLLLTEKWLPAVLFLRIFCISYAFMPIQTANLSAIKAIGRSDILLKLQIIGKVVGVAVILITMQMSVEAIAIGVAVVAIFEAIIKAVPNKKLINYGYIEQLKDIFPSIILSIFMGTCVWWLQYLELHLILVLMIQASVGVAIYLILSAIFKMESFRYLWGFIMSILGSIFKRNNKAK